MTASTKREDMPEALPLFDNRRSGPK